MMWWACPPVLNKINVSAKIWGAPTALHSCNLLFLILNFHLSISKHFLTLCPTTAHLTFGASRALEYNFGIKIVSLFSNIFEFWYVRDGEKGEKFTVFLHFCVYEQRRDHGISTCIVDIFYWADGSNLLRIMTLKI